MTPPPSLAALLFSTADPDGPFVHFDGATYTRADVIDRAQRLADSLAEHSLPPGAAVAVMLPDGIELIAALFGVWRAGCVYVPLNPRLGGDDLAHVTTILDPSVIVTTEDRIDRFAQGLVLRPDGHVIRPGAAVGPKHNLDVALIQFTSGTTGQPKPVLLGHDGVLALIDGVLDKLRGNAAPSKAPMPNLIPVSLSLWAGLYNVVFAARAGAAVIVMDGFDTAEFARLVRTFELRSTVLPPAAMTMLCDDPNIEDLAPLRYVRSITAPLSPLQARRFRDRFGIAVLNCYGQTEIGGEIIGWTAAESREFGEAKLGAVGRPHEGVRVRAIGSDGRALGSGESGELVVQTPTMSSGYTDGTDLSDRITDDGWFRTGDIGHVDADGFVWIDGRVSDMINRGGLKVFPSEVEEVLRLLPQVEDVAVVGVPDDRLGEVPVAFIVGAPVVTTALNDHARAHLAPYKTPVAYHFIDRLPRNEVGKVLKTELAKSTRRSFDRVEQP